MKVKSGIGAKLKDQERRQGVDRRQVDTGPPTKHDRRRALEPRKPEVVELDMSNSEWAALSEEPAEPAVRRRG